VPKIFLGYAGIAAVLLIIHFGYADMLAATLRLSGWRITPLFKDPFASTSLNDFWSHRWNLAFVEMDRRLFVPVLRTRLTKVQTFIGVFILSGLLHELAISFPSGGGWGGPLLYFVVQGAGVLIERKLKPKSKAGRFWTYTWLFLPIPLLFHHSFRSTFIVPPYMVLHNLLMTLSLTGLMSLALWCAGLGHFCTLAAGLQVPFRMHWQEELARISPFNRKIFLNYAAYVGLTSSPLV
jgi:alginate O-acetyltransferase complex protein AlgI